MKKLIISVLVFLVFLSAPAFAGQKNLDFSWKQKISADFAGWKLYRADTPNVAVSAATLFATIPYAGTQQTEYVTTKALVVPDGQESVQYFVLTAFDASGNESGKSNEVSIKVDFQPPETPYTLKIVIKAE